jgi:hypothetical protein
LLSVSDKINIDLIFKPLEYLKGTCFEVPAICMRFVNENESWGKQILEV